MTARTRLGDDRFLAELFRGTEGPIYVCALRNNKSKLQSGEVAHIVTRSLNEVKSFCEKWDRPEHECGIYYHTATLKPGAARRITQNCRHFISLFSDTDDANHELSRDMARDLLEQAEYPPTLIVDSGHGLQAYWLLTQSCTDADRIEKARKAIQSVTASDNVADAARVMRLVGSHNSKKGNGEWLKVEVVGYNRECRYRLEDLEHWFERAPVIIPRKLETQKPKQKHNGAAPYFYDDVPDRAVVREALRFIPNDDREDWRNVGMALNDAYGDAGFAVWAEWSVSSAKYDAADQEKNWRSFTPGGGITIGTVFYLAQQHGYHLADADDHAKRAEKKQQEQPDDTTLDADENNDARPILTLQGGNLHNIATETEAALIAAGAPLYSRSGDIVKPIVEDVPAFRGRRTKVARLKVVTPDMLRDHVCRTVKFQRYDKREKKMNVVDPPFAVVDTILARDGDWNFERLIGIITTPTLRPDGSILTTPGYDAATGLLLTSPPLMPVISEKPSRKDAEAAVKLLNDLLVEFPFVDEASRAVALSILMTPVARGAMQVVPLHAVTAPEARTGKSYLLDTAAAISTGEIAPVIAAGRDEEETEKRLAAELMTGQPIISIDNLNGDLSGDFICQTIERPIVKPRVLGRSETKRIENTVTVFCNGNNLRFIGDIAPRVILCSMDANMERPELRDFAGDPVATVLADRGRYIAAILTIIRAYLAAGSPKQCTPLPSFGDWSRLIRSPLLWLGHRDPVETMETARAEDPTRVNLRSFVAAWSKLIQPGKRMTAGELKDEASKETYGELTADRATLQAVMSAIASNRHGEIEPRKLGLWLGRHKGRVVDGYKLVGENDTHTKQLAWSLADIRANEGKR